MIATAVSAGVQADRAADQVDVALVDAELDERLAATTLRAA